MGKKVVWYCPRCHTQVATYIRLSAAPTHICNKAASKTKPLIEKETNE